MPSRQLSSNSNNHVNFSVTQQAQLPMTEEQKQQFMQDCIDRVVNTMNQANESIEGLIQILEAQKAIRGMRALYFISRQPLANLINLRNLIQLKLQQRQPHQQIVFTLFAAVAGGNPYIAIALRDDPALAVNNVVEPEPVNDPGTVGDNTEDDILSAMARLFTENNDADPNLIDDLLNAQPAGLLTANQVAANNAENETANDSENDYLVDAAKLFRSNP